MDVQELSNEIKELNKPEFRQKIRPIVSELFAKKKSQGILTDDDAIKYVLDAVVVELTPPSINNHESN